MKLFCKGAKVMVAKLLPESFYVKELQYLIILHKLWGCKHYHIDSRDNAKNLFRQFWRTIGSK